MMAVIGFFAVLFLGLVLLFMGLASAAVESGFTGRASKTSWIVAAIGIGVVTAALLNSPFVLSVGSAA